ncbi:MAG: intermembrane phospholipid transport protein YdbH family protein, partial [Methylomonas sp.]
LSLTKLSGLRLGPGQGRLDEIEFGITTGAGLIEVELQDATADYDLSIPKLEVINVALARLKFTSRPSSQPEIPIADGEFQFPLQRLTIEQLDLEADTPWGPSHFNGRAEVNAGEAGMLEAILQDAHHTIRFELVADLRTAKISVEQAQTGKVLELNANRLDQNLLQASLDANAGSLLEWLTTSKLVPESLRARAEASNPPEHRRGMASIRLQLAADTDADFDRAAAHLMLTRDKGYIASADIKLLQGSANIDGYMDMRAIDALEFLRPWLPVSVSGWQFVSGNVRGNFRLHWQPQQNIAGSAHMTASGLGLTAGSAWIENGYMELDSQDIARRTMTVSMDVPMLGFGKETKLHDLAFKAQLLDRKLTLERATLPMFGGMIEILPATVNIDQRPVLLTLGMQNIDLSQLLDSLDYPALSGSGSISGKLPLRLDSDTLEVEKGVLKGMHPGVLRYLGPAADNENIAFKALRNLTYHSLQAQVDYRPNGDYHLGLRLEGNNPEVLSGHALAFNLTISGHLPELLKNSILSGDFDQSILEQATTKLESAQEPAQPVAKPRQGVHQPMPPAADRRSQ